MFILLSKIVNLDYTNFVVKLSSSSNLIRKLIWATNSIKNVLCNTIHIGIFL